MTLAASAAGTPFSGAATGSVTCNAPVMTIKFSPPMTLSSGGTAITAKGVLKGCVTSGGNNLNIKTGKITGSFAGTGTGCSGLAGGSATTETYNIVWKGTSSDGGKATIAPTTLTIQGASPVNNFAGDVGFALPATLAGSSASGSFAGPVTAPSSVFSNMTMTALGAKCGKQLPSLKMTSGAITLP